MPAGLLCPRREKEGNYCASGFRQNEISVLVQIHPSEEPSTSVRSSCGYFFLLFFCLSTFVFTSSHIPILFFTVLFFPSHPLNVPHTSTAQGARAAGPFGAGHQGVPRAPPLVRAQERRPRRVLHPQGERRGRSRAFEQAKNPTSPSAFNVLSAISYFQFLPSSLGLWRAFVARWSGTDREVYRGRDRLGSAAQRVLDALQRSRRPRDRVSFAVLICF